MPVQPLLNTIHAMNTFAEALQAFVQVHSPCGWHVHNLRILAKISAKTLKIAPGEDTCLIWVAYIIADIIVLVSPWY